MRCTSRLAAVRCAGKCNPMGTDHRVERVCDPGTPLTTKAVIASRTLALDSETCKKEWTASLSLSTSALHGTCFATKTTTDGQPFAVTLAGITGRDLCSCWTLHWLAALHSLVSPYLQQEDAPDFLWLSTALDTNALDELAPASYCTALLCLRYAATLPWRIAGNGLLPGEARQLTLRSMKSTLLAAAAQLRLAKEIRLAQGHHRDSARLDSRNDTFDSLGAQHRLATARAQALHAASQATAPTQLDAPTQAARHQHWRNTEEPVEQFSMPSPDIIEDFSDEEAAMVEQAAQLNRSSSASSVAESSVSSQDVSRN
eukprot:s8788_g1.t1